MAVVLRAWTLWNGECDGKAVGGVSEVEVWALWRGSCWWRTDIFGSVEACNMVDLRYQGPVLWFGLSKWVTDVLLRDGQQIWLNLGVQCVCSWCAVK